MKVSEALAEAFAAEGCDAAFGLLGDANMALWTGLAATKAIPVYSARHEAGAVAMADGHHRASGRIGLATITSGPGLTQIGTSLVAAVRNRSAIVIAVGDVPHADRNNVQKFDQRRFVEACGAHFQPLTGAANLARDVADAFYIARVRRQPVVLDMPTDVQDESLAWDFDYVASSAHLPPAPGAADRGAIEALAERLLRAERPVIIAGAGARLSGARQALIALADRTGALLATSLKAKGLFTGHPFDIGIAGAFSSAPAEQLLCDADLVIGVGAELGYYTTEGGLLFPEAEVVRIDAAPWPQERSLLQGLYLHGDAAQTVAALNDLLAARGIERAGFRTPGTRSILSAPPAPREAPTDGINPRALAARLGRALPSNAVVTVGAGHFWAFFHMYAPVPQDAALYFSYQFGAIGQTLPVAVGVGVAHPGRPHLVIEGDGSLMMNLQELETAARHRIPMVVLVWNDVGLGAEVHKLAAKGQDVTLGKWPASPDFVTLARAFGGGGVRIDREDAIEAALQEGFRTGGLFVIDARVSPSAISDPYLKLQFGVENQAPLLRPAGERA